MPEENRTQFTMKAMSFADYFNVRVGDQKVSGPVSYRVQMAAPDGLSTGGGKQAVQHIKLVPDDGKGKAVIVAGAANQIEKTAEVRTFEHLAQLHAQRFKGQRIPLDRVQYGALVRRMQAFFAENGLQVVLVEAAAATEAPPASSSAGLVGFVIALFVAGAAAGGWLLFRRKH
jgi:hypothetical protein